MDTTEFKKKDIAEEITNDIYRAYGSGYGVLFGIPANLRTSVKAIVKLVLQSQQIHLKNLCSECNGAGAHPITQTKCKTCNGKGELFE